MPSSDSTSFKSSALRWDSRHGRRAGAGPRREHQSVSVDALREIHHLKTGALIAAAAEAGAICANASTAQRAALVVFAKAIGLAFQVTDDVLDVTGKRLAR